MRSKLSTMALLNGAFARNKLGKGASSTGRWQIQRKNWLVWYLEEWAITAVMCEQRARGPHERLVEGDGRKFQTSVRK